MDTLIAIIHFLPWKRVWAIQEALAYRFREHEIHFFDDEFMVYDTTEEEHQQIMAWFKDNVPEFMIGEHICPDR